METLTLITTLLLLTACYPLAVKDYSLEIQHTNNTATVATVLLNSTTRIATAYYTQALNSTGWNILHINTTSAAQDEEQLWAAGYLEGLLTHDLIDDAYYNYLNTVLEGDLISQSQQQFVSDQYRWMKEKVLNVSQSTSQETDLLSLDNKEAGQNKKLHDFLFNKNGDLAYMKSYWSLVGSILAQLEGMYEGYLKGRSMSQVNATELSFDQFYYLTNMGDLEDIQNAFLSKNKTEMNCDSYVKITSNDLICGHNTFNIYSLMLRVYKIYEFQFNNKYVRSHLQQFSSRPGDLESKDDFYLLDSGLVVMETSLNNYNQSNYQYLHSNSVPCWMRVNLANRLAKNGFEWSNIFRYYRSGTHNNQWFVIDYNNWRNNSTSNIVWMIEESFYLYKSIDFSKTLFNQSYVASYNVPYNQEIYNVTMYQEGYGFTYSNDPRAVLFQEFSVGAKSTPDVMRLIRSNGNFTGNPSNAISPRYDLLPADDGAFTFGGIDGKVVNQELVSNNEVLIVSGPTQDGFPSFNWNQWEDVPHEGMPNEYNFSWIKYSPNSKSYSNYEIATSSKTEFKSE